MGDCVPDWEDMCGATEMGASLDSLDNLLKEKWENVELSSQITSFTPLSDHDIDQGSWGKGTSSPCPEGASVEQSDSPHKACPWQVEDSVAQLQPAHEVILSAKKTVDSVQGGGDDEMVSWLQYPLDSVLDKEYYQALAGCNLPCSKELFSERAVWDCQLKKSGAWSNDTGKVGGMDVTLSSESGGTGRSGGEVLSTLSIPQIAVKRKPYVRTPPNLTIPAWSPSRTSRSSSQDQSSGVVDPAVHVVSECATMLNFPHFSRPAALVKANLQSLGVACSATNQLRPRQNISSAGSALPGASFPSSSRFDGTAFSCPVKPKLYQESPFQLRGKGMESAALIQHCSGSTKNVCLPSCPNIEGSGAVCASCYLCASQVFDVSQQAVSAYDASESILGSSIGGSSISVVRGESALPVNMKRKVGEADSECLVGEPEDESLDTKRTFVIRSSATKRSRAAEVHNLSERRRRDRINEKMRALQDLIPNSNKTDKASMLDEAIEYLKMLQLHIQMISMKSGISIPSMILPPGSQQLRTRFSRPDADWDLTLGGVKSVGSGMGLGSIDATVPRQGVTSLFTPTQVLFGSSGDDQLQNSARVDSLLPHQGGFIASKYGYAHYFLEALLPPAPPAISASARIPAIIAWYNRIFIMRQL